MKSIDQLYCEHLALEEKEREAFNALVDTVAKEATLYNVEYDYISLCCGGSYLTGIINKVKEEQEKHFCKECEQPKPDVTDDGDGLCAKCFQQLIQEREAFTER